MVGQLGGPCHHTSYSQSLTSTFDSKHQTWWSFPTRIIIFLSSVMEGGEHGNTAVSILILASNSNLANIIVLQKSLSCLCIETDNGNFWFHPTIFVNPNVNMNLLLPG